MPCYRAGVSFDWGTRLCPASPGTFLCFDPCSMTALVTLILDLQRSAALVSRLCHPS